MRQIKKKKGAIEMSIGTIVTIVLSVSFLVLGIFLIQKISKSATSVVDLTDAQLRDQVNKLFSEDSELVIYPQTKMVEIKQGSTDGVGIGIKNLREGSSETTTFSYEVKASSVSDCGEDFSESDAEDWMITGNSEDDIPIAPGDIATDKILFRIPVGSPLCTVKFRINVKADSDVYATDSFFVTVKAK
jgi:hypothetical protein